MTDADRSARSAAVSAFAEHLREVREAAGTPSYRAMAARSSAISHTTLHEAARGHRLPTWETVREYVRACDADLEPTRAAWDAAHHVVAPGCPGQDRSPAPVDAVPSDAAPPAPTTPPAPTAPALPVVEVPPTGSPTDQPEPPLGATPRRGVLHRALTLAGVAAAVALVAAVVSSLTTPDGLTGTGVQRAAAVGTGALVAAPLPTPARCPVQQPNPPAAEPAHPGDLAVFVGDATLPDCSVVEPRSTSTKVWRLKNAGTRPWVGYRLQRVGGAPSAQDCQTITHVPVPDTAPGDVVEVATAVTAPATGTFCIGRFKLTDATGAVAFPGSRPVTYQLVVR
ncbi:NBR1-Ig-like domain-containing protein [Arthrobacter sp. NEB 688]|uniref:NBR1-Ig-like domain-containing protein n=1 Tax=Arthrobacter sp. NEB 688 TaxID=904039 RepID=UPI0015655A85|nr:NBR1-Ig-like domain-containing protein [Arthrobacter sp. NEB 688]QKE85259.1 helix-turn-helix domain-containing protein [Arthrobacter sp. NEB 688]